MKKHVVISSIAALFVVGALLMLAVQIPTQNAVAGGKPKAIRGVQGGRSKASAPEVLTNPKVSKSIAFAVSRPVREIPQKEAPTGPPYEIPNPHPKLNHLMKLARGLAQVADGALQTSPGPLVAATIGLNFLGVGNGFPGYNVPDAPPDANVAIGDTQIVQWVNVQYAVFDKTTGAAQTGFINGNTFWSDLGGSCATKNSGDPIIQWDKTAHVWVVLQNVFSFPYMTCIAVSQTADATGPYFEYAFPRSGLPDYPKLGTFVNGVNNAYFYADNNFNPSFFKGVDVCAFERDKILVGDVSASQICFFDDSMGTLFDDSLLPGDQDSTTPTTIGEDEVYMGSIDNFNPGTTIYEYIFHVDFATPSNSTFTGVNGTMPISVATYGLACGGFVACIPQMGSFNNLASLGDRLMYRLAYRSFPDHEAWVVTHSVTSDSGQTGLRWYEFDDFTSSGNPTLGQQGTFAPDTNFRWMGSIAMDNQGDIALGYTESSSAMFPAVYFTGRVAGDPPGEMETEALIVAGTGSQLDTGNRWGDYWSMAVDNDGCTFVFTAEYYMQTASFKWSTQIATLKFDSCQSPAATLQSSIFRSLVPGWARTLRSRSIFPAREPTP